MSSSLSVETREKIAQIKPHISRNLDVGPIILKPIQLY
jgi:hypothetical protein